MCQKRNETAWLIWIASHGQFICSDHSWNSRAARAHWRRCVYSVTWTLSSAVRSIRKHRIHLLSYRSRGTLMSFTDQSAQRRLKSNTPNVKRLNSAKKIRRTRETLCATKQSEGFSIYTSHYLPWIYCSNTHCTMVLWQKYGIFTFNCITGVMVYN